MSDTDTDLPDAAIERYLEGEDAFEQFKRTIADGSLYDYLSRVQNARRPEDVSAVMREGPAVVDMLVPDWLVAGELHLIYAEAEAWKTWVALHLAIKVMEGGNKVAWFDEELGLPVIAERLICLGATAELIDKYFVYFPFPAWTMAPEELINHQLLIRELASANLKLVVYDTMTDMLSEANVDENSGQAVTAWVKAFPEVARQAGVTQLVLDHTAKGGDTAVGSRAKRAKAKVQYYLQVPANGRGDITTPGTVKVTLKKNTRGAHLPAERTYSIGGGNGEAGGFAFDLIKTSAGTGVSETEQRIMDDIRATVKKHGELTTNKLDELVRGGKAEVIRLAKELASRTETSGIESDIGPRNAVVYRYVEPLTLPE